ncbi:unnamed protein product [Albugo candida]|uniref:Uncharacterized protein n=1 Tax=Albugo candida TaxID=65357 RepID=A0A024FUJ2_9STRA|nr:unnamed protein product [Albugo candida]|eukprot:CCI10324.1 unnamed protein product [Albugo candida]
MAVRDHGKKEDVQGAISVSQSSSCMWVEHELGQHEWCKVFLDHLSRNDARILSSIDFLISSEEALHTISGCISFGSELGMKLCKKVTLIPDQFCHSFDMQKSRRRYDVMAPSLQKDKHSVSTGRPRIPDIKCFTCLTSELDILITDLVRFWMVGFPEKFTCQHMCGNLEMDGGQTLDISMIRPISSNAIKSSLLRGIWNEKDYIIILSLLPHIHDSGLYSLSFCLDVAFKHAGHQYKRLTSHNCSETFVSRILILSIIKHDHIRKDYRFIISAVERHYGPSKRMHNSSRCTLMCPTS